MKIEYRRLKKDAELSLFKDHQNYFSKKIEKCNKDSKLLWQTINEISGKNSKSNIDETIKKHFVNENVTVISNKLNENFVNQASKLKNKYNYKQTNTQNFDMIKCSNTMWIQEPTGMEIVNIINELNHKGAIGTDEIDIDHIIESKENSAECIKILIQKIILCEKWPSKLKSSKIRPIFKKGKKNDVDNYRPISILPAINKICEKFFANKITSFLNKNNIISTNQFGFQRGKGTTDALKFLNDTITVALNNNEIICAAFIDLQKAFDSINRTILITKLKNYGLRGKINKILENYLGNRTSLTNICDTNSDILVNNDGVPQGSVLGPLLFLLYINELELLTNNIVLFADDLCMFRIGEDYEKTMNSLQLDFDKLQMWCKVNQVFISEEKTVHMDITTIFKKIIPGTELKINVHGASTVFKSIKKVKEVKYLGYWIDNHWNHETHIDKVIAKLKQIMPKLYSIRNILNDKNKKMVYNAWIEPYLLYAIDIYGNARQNQLLRLQKIQNKILKTLFRQSKIIDIRTKWGMLDVQGLFIYRNIIKNYFKLQKELETQKSLSKLRKEHITLPLWRNKYGKMNSKYFLTNMFNELPSRLKKLNSYNKLKNELKLFLLKGP
jgi:hypothetical protein